MMELSHMQDWDMGIGWVIMAFFWLITVFGILFFLKMKVNSNHD